MNFSDISVSHLAKSAVASSALVAVGVAFELAARYDPELREELSRWRNGEVFSMGILPKGPYISIRCANGEAQYLGLGMRDPDVAILFKNLDAAMLVFTGQIGTHTAAAEKRFIIRGNISESMKIARALSIVQAYVFPRFIVMKTYKKPPAVSAQRLWIKAKIYAGLTPALLTKIARRA
ncbi:MAG: SCP2 sterol-binding domain-containing protein [Myxococcales bacterium]|nr:SCP2 sterol-binding domain-containing protein [Myxococcales bacterium]